VAHFYASLLTLAFVSSPAGQPESKSIDAFQLGVSPSFEKLTRATFPLVACRRVHKSRRKGESELAAIFGRALREFEKQVALHWPYDDEQMKERQRASQKASKEINSLFSSAKSENPPIDREEAIRRLLEIANAFPDSPVNDKARYLAARLHWDVKPRQPEQMHKAMREVEASKGPLNFYRILAKVNLASQSNSDEQRLQDRQAISKFLRGLHDPRALKQHLLNPLPSESQKDYVKRVTGTTKNIGSHYAINSANMTTDAMLTAKPE